MLSQYFFRMYMVGMWSKSSIISAIYRLVEVGMQDISSPDKVEHVIIKVHDYRLSWGLRNLTLL